MKICSVPECGREIKQRGRLCAGHLGRKYRLGNLRPRLPIGYRIHGQSGNKSSTYRSWLMMKNRCSNPKASDFKYYGAKGIKVCKRWENFKLFRQDMGDKPSPLHTIGRQNDKKGYSPKNCKWETRMQQSRARAYCKLDLEKVETLKRLHLKGIGRSELAKIFKVGKTTIAYALTGKTWAK